MPAPPSPPAKPAYSSAARTAVQETTRRVEEMHGAIADLTFSILQAIPLLTQPAGWVRRLHDAAATGVYRAIQGGSTAVFGTTARLEERHAERAAPQAPPGRLASGLRSALNGVFGDHLAEQGNALAIEMGFFHQGAPLELDAKALRAAFPKSGRRICCFIHGLACDEFSWMPKPNAGGAAKDVNLGQRLHAELGWTPLYLRYNTGLAIARNAKALAARLETLRAAWPERDCEIVLIGHSMGGLLALGACEAALADGMAWPGATRMVICLGSPQLGSPLERVGQLTNTALDLNRITAPLGRIAAARSQGIRDLRHGPGGAGPQTLAAGIALRFVGASLSADVDHPLGHLIGDGLVPLSSATAHPPAGDVDSNVASIRLGGIGHMALQKDERVYRQIHDWLERLAH